MGRRTRAGSWRTSGLGDILLELLPPPAGVDKVVGTAQRPLALTVTDVDAVIADLEAKGVEVTTQPRPGFSFFGVTAVVTDPSGLAIELREWRGGDGPHYDDWQPEVEGAVRKG